jgi:hypothetical protein
MFRVAYALPPPVATMQNIIESHKRTRFFGGKVPRKFENKFYNGRKGESNVHPEMDAAASDVMASDATMRSPM